jgi:hypothetical protein
MDLIFFFFFFFKNIHFFFLRTYMFKIVSKSVKIGHKKRYKESSKH